MGDRALRVAVEQGRQPLLSGVVQRLQLGWRVVQRHPRAVGASLLGLLLALVCLRSWVFLWFPHAHLDSDQAVFGIMAKDIAIGRAYPLFMYGQRYILAVGAWLSAPLVACFGSSITTLKFPMFAMNIGCVLMLWFGLRRERELGPWGSAFTIAPFAGTSVVLASRLVEHAGGNIEPIFFLLLGYLVRNHALALGSVFGVAFLNREYALIGVIALLMMDVAQGTLRKRVWLYIGAALVGVGVVFGVRAFADQSLGYVGQTVSPDWQNPFTGEGLAGYLDQQLPVLLGLSRIELRYFITSRLHAGHDWLRYLALLWFLLGVAGMLRLRRTDLGGLSCYVFLIGAGQLAAFILLCGSPRHFMLVRYVLMTICMWLGLTAFAWKTPALRPWIAAVVLIVTGSNVRDSFRLSREYVLHTPRHAYDGLSAALLDRGIHYVEAEFWTAYEISWLSDERIIANPPSGAGDRIPRYSDELKRHAREVIRVLRDPCDNGEHVLEWYLCPPQRKVAFPHKKPKTGR